VTFTPSTTSRTWAHLSATDSDRSLLIEPDPSRPDPPTTVGPGEVVLAIVTDTGVAVEAVLPVNHALLPDLLARRSTRVRAVAPDVALPEPRPHLATPASALLPQYRRPTTGPTDAHALPSGASAP